VGWKVQSETEEMLEDGRSGLLELVGGVPAIENVDKTGGHSRDHNIEVYRTANEAKEEGRVRA
jgi:hypothetical protein